MSEHTYKITIPKIGSTCRLVDSLRKGLRNEPVVIVDKMFDDRDLLLLDAPTVQVRLVRRPEKYWVRPADLVVID